MCMGADPVVGLKVISIAARPLVKGMFVTSHGGTTWAAAGFEPGMRHLPDYSLAGDPQVTIRWADKFMAKASPVTKESCEAGLRICGAYRPQLRDLITNKVLAELTITLRKLATAE